MEDIPIDNKKKYVIEKIKEKIEENNIKNKTINLQTFFINDNLNLLGTTFKFNNLSLFFIIIIEMFLISYLFYIFLRKEFQFIYFNLTNKFKLDLKEINKIENTKLKIENIQKAQLFCEGDNLKIIYNGKEYNAKYLEGDENIVLDNCDSYIQTIN